MYSFRLYYSVRGHNKRRSMMIRLDALCLLDAWTKALDCAIVYTRDNELLNSIQIIDKDMLEEYKRCILKEFEEEEKRQ